MEELGDQKSGTARRVLKGRLATVDNLVRRGAPLGSTAGVCCLYGDEDESVSHLFCTCKMSSFIWSIIFEWLGLSMILHSNPINHFLQVSDFLGYGSLNPIASAIWVGTVWSIWNTIKLWNWFSYRHGVLQNFGIRSWLGDPWLCLNSL